MQVPRLLNRRAENSRERGPEVKKQYSRGEAAWLCAIFVLAAVLYAPTFRYLWGRWMTDSQYSLAYLVPFVSGYFVWKSWPAVSRVERSSSSWGLVLLVTAVLLHFVGSVLDVAILSGVSILLCLLGGCLYIRGAAFTRVLWFPLAYTAFMIPVPEGLIDMVGFPLQLWASASTARILELMGIEVTRSGVNMTVPGFSFEVAQACSGMSSLVALVGVAAVFAYVTNLPAKYKWVLFVLSLPIALVANVVRITTIALVGYGISPNAALNIYHDWSSPILFLVAIMLLFVISKRLEWLNERRTSR